MRIMKKERCRSFSSMNGTACTAIRLSGQVEPMGGRQSENWLSEMGRFQKQVVLDGRKTPAAAAGESVAWTTTLGEVLESATGSDYLLASAFKSPTSRPNAA
jgi:hypothetical protein